MLERFYLPQSILKPSQGVLPNDQGATISGGGLA